MAIKFNDFKDPFSSETLSAGPHNDLQKNVQKASKFIANTKNSCNPGITLCIKDSVLWIQFSPGRESKLHVDCSPINLHQDSYLFEQEMVRQFNYLNHKAKKPNPQMEF